MDNRKFWNERYQTNMNLGSGWGSRGENRNIKSKLIKDIVEEHNIESVLDIGCGDCEVNKDIDLKEYLGLDISDYIVKLNTEKFPDRTFENKNFSDMVGIKKDLVICFDVLIHQPTQKDYEDGIRAIKESFNKVAIVAAFNDYSILPKNKINKVGIFYYEDITKSFSEYKVTELMNFDLQTIIKIEKC